MSINKETLDKLRGRLHYTNVELDQSYIDCIKCDELRYLITAAEEAENLRAQLAEKDAMLGKCVREAFEAGYGTAHNHTVDGYYAPEDSSDV
jgi:HEPN domain-containing protein